VTIAPVSKSPNFINPVQVLVFNQTTGRFATVDIDYYVDWNAQTVEIIAGAGFNTGDIVNISVYELGGGNQLYRDYYTGSEIDNTIIIPVDSAEIYQVVVFINGEAAALPHGMTEEQEHDAIHRT
jgi:hypothetical protein